MLELNLPKYAYRIRQNSDKLSIFDPIRKRFIVLTPEEWVRQHFINLLNKHLKYPSSRTSVETGMKYNSLSKRSDIMVFDNEMKPLVLVECKAPSVAINEGTVRQLAVYNSVCEAKLLVVTNGIVTYACICKQSPDKFETLKEIPNYEDLKGMI